MEDVGLRRPKKKFKTLARKICFASDLQFYYKFFDSWFCKKTLETKSYPLRPISNYDPTNFLGSHLHK